MNVKEEWRVIKEAPKYEISNYGRVMSHQHKKSRILTPKICKNGYLSVGLSCTPANRKNFLVHRLVLMTFNPTEKMEDLEVNHIDENKSNNRLDNLEWVTSSYNCNYGSRNSAIKKSRSQKVLCVETGIVYESCKQASEMTGAIRSSISNCLTGKRNKTKGYHWERVE